MVVNPPTNLLCEIGSDTLVITWDASTSAGITEYRVHVYNGSTIEKEAFVSQLSYMYIMPGTGTYSVHVRALITRTNYSVAVTSTCDGSGGSGGGGTCSGTPPNVTGIMCIKTGSTNVVSWTNPPSGTYDRIRIHYYTGTTFVTQYSNGISDSYTSSSVDSVHVRAMCGTASSPTAGIATCTSGGGNGGCVSTGYNCEAGQTGYEVDNCGNRRANSACGTTVCTPNYVCRSPLDRYEHDSNNCPGSVDRLNSVCNPVGNGGNGGTVCGAGQINLFGSCYKTSNVMIVGVGVVGLFILMR